MAENPLREGLPQVRVAEPCVMVIFGATGDLTHRKLIPALYRLADRGLLPPYFAVVGFARRSKGDKEFRQEMYEAVRAAFGDKGIDPALWERFAMGLFYHCSEFADDEGYKNLKIRLEQIDKEHGTGGNRLFYLATAPDQFELIAEQLKKFEMNRGAGWRRLVIEKPFGTDLASATALNYRLRRVFPENQIYRIDHYLGKETVQNILVTRFANAIFEPLWNQQHIDHVQITVSEILGVGSRGRFYEEVGALRDMLQNHMMQLLALMAMEPPVALDPEAIRDEKVKVLRSLRAMSPDDIRGEVVRAQYAAGSLGGENVPGYVQEENVDPKSSTETYVALKLWIDNWRWAGVPFYLRHGKRLPKQGSEIAIQFKSVPQVLFNKSEQSNLSPNTLVIRIQPDEGIALKIDTKVPGPEMTMNAVKMDFRYGQVYGHESPEAYERLLLDAIAGDPTL
ncbi:MAG: glucose-6-phosphate dehydrogenase, partial [Verrucomicrobiae bacterium]|nr:glucose-6-phosphate dehydrogenase [Verrucomicrobiae bacterium]